MILMSAVKRINPNFSILKEAKREVLEDLMDIHNTKLIIEGIESKKIKLQEISTQIPSPFAFFEVIKKNRAFSVLVVPLFFFVLGFLIYSNVVRGEFVFDDTAVIVDNPNIRNWTALGTIFNEFNTRFLVGFSFALNYALGRLDTAGYHVFNILIHIGTALWTWRFIRLIYRTPRFSGSTHAQHAGLLALFGGLLFLVHPLQTQAVSYVWQRAASMAAFFYLGSAALYLDARMTRRRSAYAGALGMSVLAMFTKEHAVTLPVMLLALELFLFGLPRVNLWKRAVFIAPFLITVLIVPLTFMRPGRIGSDFFMSHTAEKVQMAGEETESVKVDLARWVPEEVMSRKDYYLTQTRVLCTYLRLLFVPVNQNADYDYPVSKSLSDFRVWLALLVLSGICLLAVLNRRRRPFLLLGVFWFFLTLSIETLVVFQDMIFEHRLYLPMAGFCLFLPPALFVWLKDVKRAAIVLTVIALVFSGAAYRRNFVWQGPEALWSDVIKKSPNKYRGHGNLARMALEKDPQSADAYNILGAAFAGKGDVIQALESYRKALVLDPNHAETYYNLALIHGKMGEFKKAVEHCKKAVKIKPDYAEAYYNMGIAYDYLKDKENAKKQVEQLRRLNRKDLAYSLEKSIS